jgi:hypothetical protein
VLRRCSLEKTLHRSGSNSSADRQRRQFASELDDPNHVEGVPEHDFTAGTSHGGYGAGIGVGVGAGDMYNQDPYYHSDAYEYDQAYGQHQHSHAYPPTGAYDQAAYPQHDDGYDHAHAHEYPSQDQPAQDGYADLQRGNSIGSGSGHGHEYAQNAAPAHGHDGSAHGHGMVPHQQVYPNGFPSPEDYIGRPTGGNDGP